MTAVLAAQGRGLFVYVSLMQLSIYIKRCFANSTYRGYSIEKKNPNYVVINTFKGLFKGR